jgi:hypothetical protein
MEEIIRAVTEHPLVAMAVCLSALLLVYFLFKSLIKLALILIIVAIAIGSYFYFQYPESRPANLKDAVEKARTGAGKAVDRGKEAYEKVKEWVDKGRIVLDKGIDKGKDAVEKGKDAASDIGKLLDGNKKAGDRRKP